jgi:hypothetical protein
MWVLGPVGFTAPILLTALVALPILWLILRAVPPAPIRRRFPGVALLLGLTDDEAQTDRTPWWLLLLRMLAVAAVIIGFAGPILNPQVERDGTGPLLIVMDGTWADARDWPRRIERADALLDEAARAGRTVAVVTLTDLPEGELPFQAADAWARQLPSVEPSPWLPDGDAVLAWADALDALFETFWMSDGLAAGWRAEALAAFETHGAVAVFESPRPIFALAPARYEDGAVIVPARRARAGEPADIEIVAHGTDPAGTPRVLATGTASFDADADGTELALSVPSAASAAGRSGPAGAVRRTAGRGPGSRPWPAPAAT